MTLTPRALALLVPGLMVACGCSSSPGQARGDEPERVRGSLVTDTRDPTISAAQDEVARRRSATPEDVFAVGSPQDLDVRPDGSLITSWQASADSEGEGPNQRAWRVFDARRHRLAQGRMAETGDVVAVGDGFLVVDGADSLDHVRHVDLAGDVTGVRLTGRRAYPRRGDTLLPDLAAFYRPSSGTLLRSPTAPEVRQDGVAAGRNTALSDSGLLYEYADPPRSPLPLGVTSDGGDRWRYTRLAVGALRASLVAARGDTAVLVLSRRSPPAGVGGLSVTEDGGRTWRRTGPPAGLPRDAYVDHLALGADGRALVGEYGTGWWRALPGEPGAYSRLPLPRDGVAEVLASRSRLFAVSRSAVWSSTDGGRYWTSVDVRD